jgi:hypothetical protein
MAQAASEWWNQPSTFIPDMLNAIGNTGKRIGGGIYNIGAYVINEALIPLAGWFGGNIYYIYQNDPLYITTCVTFILKGAFVTVSKLAAQNSEVTPKNRTSQ